MGIAMDADEAAEADHSIYVGFDETIVNGRIAYMPGIAYRAKFLPCFEKFARFRAGDRLHWLTPCVGERCLVTSLVL